MLFYQYRVIGQTFEVQMFYNGSTILTVNSGNASPPRIVISDDVAYVGVWGTVRLYVGQEGLCWIYKYKGSESDREYALNERINVGEGFDGFRF